MPRMASIAAPTGVVAFIILLMLAPTSIVLAAQFRVVPLCSVSIFPNCRNVDKHVYVIGQIVSGDADRFEALLRQIGPEIPTIELRSQGGSVTEAFRMGRLIRSLFLRTSTIESTYGPAMCAREGASFEIEVPCLCASSCFLIWVAGLERNGTEIFLHRIRFDLDSFKKLKFEDAGQLYKTGMQTVHSYLTEMSIPDRYYEKMLRASSNEMDRLTETEASELGRGDAAYSEWLYANCPIPFGQARTVRQSECTSQVTIEKRYEAFQKILGTPTLTPPKVCERYPIVCRQSQP
jgi:hypothetical protein